MYLPDDIFAVTVLGVLALALATLAAHLFLRTGVPGGARSAGLVGGVVLGLLGGVGVTGVMAPGLFDAWAVGGVLEQKLLDDYDAATASYVEALRMTGVSPEAIPEYADERRAGRGTLLDELSAARGARTEMVRTLAQSLLGLALLCTAPYWLGVGRASGVPNGLGVVIGAVIAVAFGGLVAGALQPAIPPLVAAGVVAACALLVPSPSKRTPTALVVPVIVAFFLCISAVRLLHTAQGPFTPPGVVGSSIMVIAGLGLVFAWPLYHLLTRATERRVRQRAASVALLTLVPASVALSLLRVDPHPLWGDWVFWVFVVVAVVASSDLRWYALARVLRLFRRERPYTDAEASANAGGGIVQLVVATAGFHAALIDDRAFLALILGGAVGEMSVALRTKIARAMQEGRSIVEAIAPADDEL